VSLPIVSRAHALCGITNTDAQAWLNATVLYLGESSPNAIYLAAETVNSIFSKIFLGYVMKKAVLILALAVLSAAANATSVVFDVPDGWTGGVRGRVIPVHGFFFNGDDWFSSATYGDSPGRPIALLPNDSSVTIGYRGSYTFTGITMDYKAYEGALDVGPRNAAFELLDASGTVLAKFTALLTYGAGFQTYGSVVDNVSTIRFLRSDLTPRIESIGVDNVITAVPEPSAFMMMFGGLGLIGWISRRSRKRSSTAALSTASVA
jgi:hypothetical protein